MQSFSPEDNISPETAHEIGLKFAEYFGNYQMVIATHTDRNQEYETPQSGIISDDLFNLIGNLLDLEMQNNSKRNWMPHHNKKEIEKLIAQGQKITNENYDEEYDEYHGIGMFM